jgi:hypothetical protein
MPEPEVALLRAVYGDADTILEYGSGGSTVLAGDMVGKSVFSVESDRTWATMMRDWFVAHPPASKVEVIWADIGPTVEWGHPKDDRAWKRYGRYPLAVWDREDMAHPDVVLVDGRFRLGCVLATAFSATRPVTLLFDDYLRRKFYHTVEDYVGQPDMTGRMARFEIKPQAIEPKMLLQVMRLMSNP